MSSGTDSISYTTAAVVHGCTSEFEVWPLVPGGGGALFSWQLCMHFTLGPRAVHLLLAVQPPTLHRASEAPYLTLIHIHSFTGSSA